MYLLLVVCLYSNYIPCRYISVPTYLINLSTVPLVQL